MTAEEFLHIVQISHHYAEGTSREKTMAQQLNFSYEIHWYDWDVIATFIGHPDAELALIAEAWRFAPDFVEAQPRWAELAQHPAWAAAVAQAQRELPAPNRNWGQVPAYYVRHLIAQKNIKALCLVLESHSVDKGFVARWGSDLMALGHQSIDLRIMDQYAVDAATMGPILDKFATSKYATVRLAVARHEHAGPDALRLLCTDRDEKIAKAAASHKQFPGDALELVAQHEEARQGDRLDRLETLGWKELGDFLGNPDFPAEGLDILAARDDAAIRFACAMHPNASEALLRATLAEPEDWRKAAAALNPALPVAMMTQLADIDSVDIAFALAGNPALPEALQLTLAVHPSRMVRLHLADHTSSHAVLSLIAAQPGRADVHTTFEQLLAVAIDPKSPASKIGNLQAATNTRRSNGEALASSLGYAIARHPKVPEKLLGKMRHALPELIAANPGVQLRLLEGLPLPDPEPVPEWKMNGPEVGKYPGYYINHLLLSKELSVQRMACDHIGCDKALLLPLWLVPDTVLLKKLAQRTDMPRFFYEMLWLLGGESVRAALKANKAARQLTDFRAAPASAVAAPAVKIDARGAIKGNKKERIALASTSTDEAILLALAADKLSEVRDALTNQSSLPWAVVALLSRDAELDIRRRMPAYLAAFPIEQSAAIESALLAEGGVVAESVADHTRNPALQEQMLGKYERRLAYNDHLAPALAEHYLYHGAIDALQRVAGNLEGLPGFSLKAADFLLQVLDHRRGDPLLSLRVLYAAPDEQQQRHHLERIRTYFEQEGERIIFTYYTVQAIVERYPDDPGMQALLARSLGPQTSRENRHWAARLSKHLDDEVIARVMQEGSAGREALAGNPALPAHAADVLKSDADPEVRAALAGWNTRLASHFVNDPATEVRAALAKMTSDVALQRQLLANKQEDVLAGLAQNPHCDSAMMAGLVAANRNYAVRIRVANHPATSLETLQVLLQDRHGDVRANAARVIEERAGAGQESV
ncbi:hypothetical protein HF313_18590 [Massilia atriviolacea]|uniref:Leucine rich repeat variant n=1 Tax=Massilia atriviolacea TaxID=2495579 RepID=A0A430HT38_9BURK|nr:hypothetical protein [Massilia atriviolacea]RSZ60708.1 hypothetical protein EJB06_00795 [Massilia atriviolacea]